MKIMMTVRKKGVFYGGDDGDDYDDVDGNGGDYNVDVDEDGDDGDDDDVDKRGWAKPINCGSSSATFDPKTCQLA